jgi:formate hydrogenlyase subunit 6/NADH:ubiquinone oxidoreductase subunit I
MEPQPQIDVNRCTGCMRCIEHCPTRALDQKNGKAHLGYPERCTYCGDCEELCPEQAIALPYIIVIAPPRSG